MLVERAYLGTFELIVLLALRRLRVNTYSIIIRYEIEDRINKKVSVTAVYTTLERLEKKGLVSSAKGTKTAVRGGRAKKYFFITDAGLSAIHKIKTVLEDMWGDHEILP